MATAYCAVVARWGVTAVAVVEPSVLWDGTDLLSGVADAAERFRLRDVPILVVAWPDDDLSI